MKLIVISTTKNFQLIIQPSYFETIIIFIEWSKPNMLHVIHVIYYIVFDATVMFLCWRILERTIEQ